MHGETMKFVNYFEFLLLEINYG